MDNPEKYRKANAIQKRDVRFVLENYGADIFKFDKDSQPCRVLDLGCGPGDVTLELIAPFFPPKNASGGSAHRNPPLEPTGTRDHCCFDSRSEVVGIDADPAMIQTARTWGSRLNPDVRFIVCNAYQTARLLGEEIEHKFDYVISNYLLHWVQDITGIMKEVRQVHKKNGELLAIFLASSPIFEVYKDIYQAGKWSKYMKDFELAIGPYHRSPDPEAEVRRDFEQAGYEVLICDCIHSVMEIPSLGHLKHAMEVVNPFLQHMRAEERGEYLEDLLEAAVPYTSLRDDGTRTAPYELMVVHTRNPQ
ncbi:unnamed protein product [Cyprideis torosa]|uniref:Juvenile hormone acid methyltransferase n=1 Tax=Cyprideis torosa TaxID=163714 RepID=A0A7R8ZM65_9CRUS|nr:unnamed protein product [Cyprideis torosa]CAG0894833.1 unnamed protein product [Cyprideis torosa]